MQLRVTKLRDQIAAPARTILLVLLSAAGIVFIIARGDAKLFDFNAEVIRRVGSVPGVDGVAAGSFVPWRDAGDTGQRVNFSFAAEGYTPADGEEPPRARARFVSPLFFSVLGIRLVEGREFTDAVMEALRSE